MKTAQDYISGNGGSAFAGFNRRVHGFTYSQAFQYPHEHQDMELVSGWHLADSLINSGKIFYRHNFHRSHGNCSGCAFLYGGFWVCNTCGNKDVDKPWWVIKVYKDGDQWCCIGEGFENLQESDNYAFGATRDEAINNYGSIMAAKQNT